MKHHLVSAKLQLLTSSDPRVRIGCYTYGNPRFMLWNEADQVTIGKFCSIAENVVIFGGGEHRSDWVTTFPIRVMFGLEGAWKDGIPTTKGVTIIGNDVWIGYGATILSGVRIGDGAIIGACSVVAQDVPPYGIAVGNPIEVIRFRFTPEVVSELLKIKWWDWSIDRIIEAADLLSSPDLSAFIEYARKNK